MVRKVNKIDKKNYKKESKTSYLIIGLAAVALIAVVMYMGLGGATSTALAGPAPSGNNCPENIAYLQAGVDKYYEVTGQVPTELTQLVETINNEVPVVEKLVECPSGNLYVIDNGRVIETAKK